MTDFTDVLVAALLLGAIAGVLLGLVLGFLAGARWVRRRPNGRRVEEALAVANGQLRPRRLSRTERRKWRRLAAELERA